MTLIWIVVFVVALAVLIKSAHWLLDSAERIGLALGMSPFIIGITIISAGTSLPELMSSIIAVFRDATEIVPANAVGSNIANILFIGGLSSVVAGGLWMKKKRLGVDMILLGVITGFGVFLISDGLVTRAEAVILLIVYVAYIVFSLKFQNGDHVSKKSKVQGKDILILAIGLFGLFVGAKYLIESVIELSDIFDIAPGVISLLAIAFGTSLPELIVSIKAARAGKPEIVVGDILGSNIFNIMLVLGIPGLIRPLAVDTSTISPGIPIVLGATLLFMLTGVYKKIPVWLGWTMFAFYVGFILHVSGILTFI